LCPFALIELVTFYRKLEEKTVPNREGAIYGWIVAALAGMAAFVGTLAVVDFAVSWL
jgi:hypothetical protein